VGGGVIAANRIAPVAIDFRGHEIAHADRFLDRLDAMRARGDVKKDVDARHLVISCSMLGLCFLDKGLPELAIKWYQRGLAAPSVSEEDSLGLLYDLGNVYLSVGDNSTAYHTYVELYGINSNYRDVVAKLEELGRAR